MSNAINMLENFSKTDLTFVDVKNNEFGEFFLVSDADEWHELEDGQPMPEETIGNGKYYTYDSKGWIYPINQKEFFELIPWLAERQ